ncbi:hypothetical protein BMS3Bbin14_01062 [bacterium BMS3Bbin14]|nr:hypothetical protein BMS3Abin13_01884 [bacterium BMS3Abin13]GBE52588.1 hypothetical protein BMS3Bbin14_01062 [bacterium BMS3Bbin14]
MKQGPGRKKRPLSYRERTYRQAGQSGLLSTFVRMVETDLHILAPLDVEDEALRLVAGVRSQVEGYIRHNPVFRHSLRPLPRDATAPAVVREMLVAGRLAGVGPMAAVAGAIAEAVGRGLQKSGVDDLIVENGGDIFTARTRECTVAVFAGESPLSGRVGIRLAPEMMPCGVCCSSGTVGHSLSLGVADAVVVVAPSTAVADAAATRIGNEVGRGRGGLGHALEMVKELSDISGAVIIRDQQIGAWGAVELVRL